MPYRIIYTVEARHHLRGLTARQQRLVMDAVDEQLQHQPTVPTRNRKQMRENPLASWELRVGTLRVYYTVDDEPEPDVRIRAIGVKVGSRVFIEGVEEDL